MDVLSLKGPHKRVETPWRGAGSVSKVWDKEARSFVYTCKGGPRTGMRFPEDVKEHLGLVFPFVVLQVLLPKDKPFSVEFELRDAANVRRRLSVSSAFTRISAHGLHAQLPLGDLPRGEWVSLCFPVADILAQCFRRGRQQPFHSCDAIRVGAVCRLLRVCLLQHLPSIVENDKKNGDDDKTEQKKGAYLHLKLPDDFATECRFSHSPPGPDVTVYALHHHRRRRSGSSTGSGNKGKRGRRTGRRRSTSTAAAAAAAATSVTSTATTTTTSAAAITITTTTTSYPALCVDGYRVGGGTPWRWPSHHRH